MRRRSALVLVLCLGAGVLLEIPRVRSVVHAREEVRAKPYRVAFTFEGLFTFVPVGKAADGKTAKELWVLSPAAERIKTITDQAGGRRSDKDFRPKDGKYVAHHTLLCAPAAAVTNPGGGEGQLLTVLDGGLRDLELGGLPAADKCDGLADPKKCVDLEKLEDVPEVRDGGATARACAGCIGNGAPAVLPHGSTVPLGLRMVFNHKSTVSVAYHMGAEWHYSKGDNNGRRRLPLAVTVTTEELTGPTSLTIKGQGQEMRLAIAPPADGKTVTFSVVNAPAAEVLDRQGEGMSGMSREIPLEHFRLGYLLAPKATTSGRPYDYDYADYLHPIVRPTMPPAAPLPFCRALGGMVTTTNGDPFCTSPSRMEP